VRWSKPDWLALGVLCAGLGLLALERAPLAAKYREITRERDAYLLPPPDQTVVLSLGYRSALADLIFGHVLVATGLHMSEKRLFDLAGQYIETINRLDPKFRDPYRYADAILTLQTVPVPEDLYRQARDILRRGTRELPYDQALWASAGQFMAYLAPGALRDPTEREAFRQEGARLLAHACELIGSNENIPYHCLTAAALFSEAGNRAASRAFLEKLRVVSDDPEIRRIADAQLAKLDREEGKLDSRLSTDRFEQLWREDLPFVSHAGMAAIGPSFDPAACAGRRHLTLADSCATTFRERLARPPDAP
jgi:hypothetical protein